MARIGRAGTGFSSINPNKAVDTFAGIQARNRMKKSSRHHHHRRTSRVDVVSIKGNIVKINGQGYSVAPSLQEDFIKRKTGGRGASAVFAMSYARKLEEQRRAREKARIEKEIKQKELELKNARMSSNRNKEALLKKQRLELKLKRQKLNNFNYRNFQRDLKSGKIQGYSGTGLSQSEQAKRQFLIDTGIMKERSSKKNILFNLPSTTSTYYLDKIPTKKVNTDFTRLLQTSTFSDAVHSAWKSTKHYKNGLDKFFRGSIPKFMDSGAKELSNKIFQRAEAIKSNSKLLKGKSIKQDKRLNTLNKLLIDYIKTYYLKPGSKVAKHSKLATLYFYGYLFDDIASIPGMARDVKAISVSAVKGTPKFIKDLGTHPIKTSKNVAVSGWKLSGRIKKSIVEELKLDAKLLKVNKTKFVGKIGEDFFIIKTTESGFKILGKVLKPLARKLNPYFYKVKNKKIVIKSVPEEIFKVKGKERYLKRRVKKPSIKRPSSLIDKALGRKPGQFRKFQKGAGQELKLGTIGKGMTLKEQLEYTGKVGTPVSLQADQIINNLRRKRLVRKPIPNEAMIKGRTKQLLAKFDKSLEAKGRKLTNKELLELNNGILRYTGKSILERSTYASPNNVVRYTRLSKDRTANLKDYLTGNIKLRGSKPQILIFNNAQVQALPKRLQTKIKKGLKLTKRDTDELILYQMEKTGKFKGIGDTKYRGGIEPEVTIAPGEIIKKVKKIGFTEIDGVKVRIYTAEIYKPSKKIKELLEKFKKGLLSKKDQAKLEKILSRETHTKVKLRNKRTRRTKNKSKSYKTSSKKTTTRRQAPKQKAVVRLSGKQKVRVGRRVIRTTLRTKAKTRTPRSRVRTPRAKTRVSPRARTMTRSLKFKNEKLKREQNVYYVKIKRRGKIVKLTPKPLTLKDARDFLAYKLDNTLSRSAWFEPIGKSKNVVRPPKVIRGYFNKKKKKLRPYKIRVGKKKQIRQGYIEKRKYLADTKTEKRQLVNSKRTRRKK